MEKITVTKISDIQFQVKVESSRITEHRVTLSKDYYIQLTDKKISPESLIERSFQFLLEREPNTSILSSFDLPVISRYFPEYEAEIKNKI